MKKVLLDTNIILDIALKREPHFEHSAKIFELIDSKLILGFITATTVTDIYYISKKDKGNKIAIEFISNLISVVDVIGVDKNTILHALQSKIVDFEDAIQAAASEYADIEIIITRNVTDFTHSNIKVLSPKELIKMMK